MPRPVRRPAHERGVRGAAGFSLIEILVVITIIGLLMTLGFGPVQTALENGKVTKCRKHLSDIGQSLLQWREERNSGRWPSQSGVRFLLRLYETGELEGRNSETFLCPGTEDRNDVGPSGKPGSSYDDIANVDSGSISYAGRDQAAFPIKGSDLSSIVIASDDNEGRANHKYMTNYVYADGSIESFDIKSEAGAAILAERPEIAKEGLPIGPDCPFETLQVLRVD